MGECEKWLAKLLAGQKFVDCEKIRIEATEKGFTKGQLSIARKALGVTSVSDSVLHNGRAKTWFWLIPKEAV